MRLAELLFEVDKSQLFVVSNVFQKEDFEIIQILFLVRGEEGLPCFFGSHCGLWIRFYHQMSPKSSCESPHAFKAALDRKSTRLNSSHLVISYAVFCLKTK